MQMTDQKSKGGILQLIAYGAGDHHNELQPKWSNLRSTGFEPVYACDKI
jgi:hypothetical protein